MYRLRGVVKINVWRTSRLPQAPCSMNCKEYLSESMHVNVELPELLWSIFPGVRSKAHDKAIEVDHPFILPDESVLQ